jgi:hypothetical protein
VRWYGDDFDDRLATAGLASVRVTPPALVGDAAVSWFHLMEHEVVWVARPGHGCATPLPRDGGSGLAAAFDALLADLARAEGRLVRAQARIDRLTAQRDALRARSVVAHPAARHGMITRLRRVVHL